MRPLAFIMMSLLPTLAVADMIGISVPSAVCETVDVYRAECTNEGGELELDDDAIFKPSLLVSVFEIIPNKLRINPFLAWSRLCRRLHCLGPIELLLGHS